jgi:aarF domain-containing kinase
MNILGSKLIGKSATAATILGGTYFYQTDDAFNRTLRFYSVAVPAYLHYELTDRYSRNLPSADREKLFTDLHDKYSPILHSHVLKMRGFFLKAAQLMSIREDYLPPQYLEWTAKMQSEAPVVFSAKTAKEIIQSEYSEKLFSDIFCDFQETPIGSASIGQVYKARLRSTGEWVAIKVQSPNIESQFRADLKACKAFCKVALPHLVVSLEEIERQFLTEFDYQLEALNLNEIRNNLFPFWSDKVIVPKPFLDLCTKRVLVMEFVPGRKVSDIFNEYIEMLAAKNGKSVTEIKSVLRDHLMKQGLSHTGLRKWSDRFLNIGTWILSTVSLGVYKRPEIFNAVALLETAMKVHGHQIFKNRTFNGDPHPGNILLTPDGKLALIDFGQVKRLPEEITKKFAQLVIALNDDDRESVCRIAHEIGCQNEFNIPDIVWRLTAFWLDRDTPDVTLGMDIHKFLEEMERRDPQKKLCQDLVMVGRCSVMLRSLGLSLGLRVKTSDYWRSYAEDFLAKEK